jgi:hypothetical protein
MARTASAQATASSITIQKLARQPKFWSMTVAKGTPRTVASMRPPRTIDAAFPRASGETSSAQIASDTPKQADTATPFTTRAKAMIS